MLAKVYCHVADEFKSLASFIFYISVLAFSDICIYQFCLEECVALMVGPVLAKSAQEFSLDGKIQNIDFVIGSEFMYELPDDS